MDRAGRRHHGKRLSAGAPGSHRRGVIYPDRDQEDPRFDCAAEAYDFPYRDSDAVPVQVAAGSVVFSTATCCYRSLPNTARSGLRRALVNHYMSAQSLLPWTRPPANVHVANGTPATSS